MPTILIADDSAMRRRIISSVLEQEGFETVAAVNGLEAVQAVFRDRPDAVILDVGLPRLSGYVVTRLLKDESMTADVPVLIITSREATSDRYYGEQTGADRFLNSDFGAHELVSAIQELLADAADQQTQRPPAQAPVVELDDEDVLARVSELLDRKLFEAKVSADVTRIAAGVFGFEETIAAVLELLGRIVDYDMAAIFLLDTRATYLTVGGESSTRQYHQFCASIADVATNLLGQPVMVTDLVPRVADPQGLLGVDHEDDIQTFLTLPLHVRGRVLGCLALASSTPDAFGDAAQDILRLIEQPVAVVINTQLAPEPVVAHVA